MIHTTIAFLTWRAVFNMLAQAVVEFFKYKVVSSIIVLACWPPRDQIKFTRQISQHGLTATISCDPDILDHIRYGYLQGVMYVTREQDEVLMFEKIKKTHFMKDYKWLILGDHVPDALRMIRYDCDVVFLKWGNMASNKTRNTTALTTKLPSSPLHFYDVYVHPRDGMFVNFWAHWTVTSGLVVRHDRERILRRFDLKNYPLKIATPVGHYANGKYDGAFVDYLEDETISDQDPAIRSAYSTAKILIEIVNGEHVLIQNDYWTSMVTNNSMYLMMIKGQADISGSILRIRYERVLIFDYVVPIWPLRVGFTYLAERESSSNMYLEPFSPGVWWSCLAILIVLAMVERITAQTPQEKDGALYTVLTTWLQQDASAVPENASGRWAFTVLSISAMLVHAYYTSAIVSALMSTGHGRPLSMRALGDSKYAIASEDYDYMRILFFDVETNWDGLEYLKKKKMTSKFYKEIEVGVKLIEQGNTAYHGEYNQLYPHFKTFTDDQICKLQHIDTVPETLTWVVATKHGQWTEVLRIAGAWMTETGLRKRLVNRLRIPHPPCRASLLAERVKIGDIAPLLALSAFGAFLSVVLLGVEIMIAKARKRRIGEGNAQAADDGEDNDIVKTI